MIIAEFAYALAQSGMLDSAARVIARAAVSAPRNPFVAYTQGIVAERQGDAARSAQRMRTAAESAPIPFFTGALARALALSGDSAGAVAIRAELTSLNAAPAAAFGRVIAGLQQESPDALFDGLQRAASESDPFVLLLPLRDPWYDRLRSDARFAALAERLGLPPTSIAPISAGGKRNGG